MSEETPPRAGEVTSTGGEQPAPTRRTAFRLVPGEVESALVTGDQAGILEDYFGAEAYRELCDLARDASRVRRGGQRVLILPGIMGSTLGRKAAIGIFDDVIWLDPIDIGLGHMDRLIYPGAPGSIRPLGVILLAYLKLKLWLRRSGFDPDFHPFDWRASLDDLGAELAGRIAGEGEHVALVCHSMGGLVARAALAKGARCERVVQLGTPNCGSFVPVAALRATYPIVRRLGTIDVTHSPEWLAEHVLATFPGLIQMLPTREVFSGVDLYNLPTWPDDGLRPSADLLAGASAVQHGLAGGDDSFFLIAGVNQDTITGMHLDENGGFVLEKSDDGDGTVPLAFTRLAGLPPGQTYYVEESHGTLPNNSRVCGAVEDILRTGATKALDTDRPPSSRGRVTREVREAELRTMPYPTRGSEGLSSREMRELLVELAGPPTSRAVVSPPGAAGPTMVATVGYSHPFDRVVVGRRRQHRIDLRLVHGSITEADSRALAVGIFRDVTPSGAARALDERLDGAITELSHRRMFSGNVGEIFMMPTGRHPMPADLVAFAGLGSFDRFNDDVLRIAAENLIRTMINAWVEELATVVFSGSSREALGGGLRSMLAGFVRGLLDADRDHHFRRVMVCETDPERYLAIKEELYRLSSTPMCDDVEITFDEVTLPAPRVAPAPSRVAAPGLDPVYLIVRQEGGDVRASLLTAGGKASVVSGVVPYDAGALKGLIGRIANNTEPSFGELGTELASRVLVKEVRDVLARYRDHHIVVVHDAPLSVVPWEVIAVPREDAAAWRPAAEKGISHRYAADNLSVATWLRERLLDRVLRVLLVVDPTSELEGAEAEGTAIKKMLGGVEDIQVTTLLQGEATRTRLLSELRSGTWDVVHYAGHASFDPDQRARSGILCAGNDVLSGEDIAGLGNLPALVFFNACETARVRGEKRKDRTPEVARDEVDRTVSFAEAFLRGGVANFLGTYWPIGDAAATSFSTSFYRELLAGRTVTDALQAGRRAVREANSADWADYVFYGIPDFVLKAGQELR